MTSFLGTDIVNLGWSCPGWVGAFYPLDLPVDWRLAYFANEFPSVLVPSDLWSSANESLLRAWCEDVPDGFRFYLQYPGTTADPEQWELARRALGAKLAGLVSKKGAAAPGVADRFELLAEAGIAPAEDCLPAWRIPGTCVRDLRAGRSWLETLNTPDIGDRGLLVLAGEDVRAEDLQRWWQLLWLMGAA